MHNFGAPLIVAALFAAGAWLSHHFQKGPRFHAWCWAGGFFFGVFGVSTVLYALTGSASTSLGTFVLLMVTGISGICFVVEAVWAHKYHPVLTPIVGAVFGTAFAVTLASWHRSAHAAGTLVPNTRQAISQQMSQVATGHAAQMMTPAQQTYYTELTIGALLGFAVLMWWLQRRRRKNGTQMRRPKPMSAPTGALKAGRRALGGGGGKKAAGWDYGNPADVLGGNPGSVPPRSKPAGALPRGGR
jgi:hypothetical protein